MLGALVAWSSVATVIGALQWVGWGIVDAWPQGDRQPSFLGPHDFAALSGMALLAGIVGLLWAGNDSNVRTAGDPRPLVIHGVQRLFHGPVRLERWARPPA